MPHITDEEFKSIEEWEISQTPKPNSEQVAALLRVIETADDERPIQKHLADNPRLWSPLLGGGHGRWVRPKVKFGDRFEADFMIADADSAGIHWVYVELESPHAMAFKANGEYADKARHALFQIRSWREFVQENGDYVRKPRKRGGLSLPHLRSKDRGIIFVGRRESMGEDVANLRRQTDEDERVSIHSYDWLVERLEEIAVHPSHNHHAGGVIPYSDEEIREQLDLMHAKPGSDEPEGSDLSHLDPGDVDPGDFDPGDLDPGDYEPA